jgi:hypothetical protein
MMLRYEALEVLAWSHREKLDIYDDSHLLFILLEQTRRLVIMCSEVFPLITGLIVIETITYPTGTELPASDNDSAGTRVSSPKLPHERHFHLPVRFRRLK